jgi:hypothetical protein
VESEVILLEKALAEQTHGRETDSQGKNSTSSTDDTQKMDWNKIAEQIASRMNDSSTWIKVEQRLEKMSKEELIAVLDEIATLDLPARSKQILESMILTSLIEKDPEYALTKFIDRIDVSQSEMSYDLSKALAEWAKKDLVKAIVWFDQQIAAGRFDGKSLNGENQSRVTFESAMIGVLIGNDLALAATRLTALPEDQRDDVLIRQSFRSKETNHQMAYAKLVREYAPKKEQADTIAAGARTLISRNDSYFSKLSEFLNRIEATPDERAATADQAAQYQILDLRRKITSEDLESMRTGMKILAPEAEDFAIGKALVSGLRNDRIEFADLVALALKYDETSGNNEVICAFLESEQALNHKEESRALAEKIADEKRRAQILKTLN